MALGRRDCGLTFETRHRRKDGTRLPGRGQLVRGRRGRRAPVAEHRPGRQRPAAGRGGPAGRRGAVPRADGAGPVQRPGPRPGRADPAGQPGVGGAVGRHPGPDRRLQRPRRPAARGQGRPAAHPPGLRRGAGRHPGHPVRPERDDPRPDPPRRPAPVGVGRRLPAEGRRRAGPEVVLVHQDITDRQRAEEAARFLADAGRRRSPPWWTTQSTLQQVARLAVPALADWCAVDLAGRGRGSHGGWPSPTPTRPATPMAANWTGYPPRADAPHGAGHVLRTGQSELSGTSPTRCSRRWSATRTTWRPCADLGLRSFLCVPLIGRGGPLGAVVVRGRHESGRRYDEQDLARGRGPRPPGRRSPSRTPGCTRSCGRPTGGRTSSWPCWPTSCATRWPRSATRCTPEAGRRPTPAVAGRARGDDRAAGRPPGPAGGRPAGRGAGSCGEGRTAAGAGRPGRPWSPGRSRRPARWSRPAGTSWRSTCPPSRCWLDADPARLAQVLGNLLTNAAKYTDPGGRIRLAAEPEGGEAVVRVRDTGIGIAGRHAAHVFDLFVQVGRRRASRSQGGLGHRAGAGQDAWSSCTAGRCEAHSDGPGPGQRVRRPPARAAGDDADRPDGRAPSRPATRSAIADRRRVLVVDDNRDAADSLAMLLRAQGARGAGGPRRPGGPGGGRGVPARTWSCSTSGCRGWTATRWPGGFGSGLRRPGDRGADRVGPGGRPPADAGSRASTTTWSSRWTRPSWTPLLAGLRGPGQVPRAERHRAVPLRKLAISQLRRPRRGQPWSASARRTYPAALAPAQPRSRLAQTRTPDPRTARWTTCPPGSPSNSSSSSATLLAMETYVTQVRAIVADTRKMLDEMKYGPLGPGGDRFNRN